MKSIIISFLPLLLLLPVIAVLFWRTLSKTNNLLHFTELCHVCALLLFSIQVSLKPADPVYVILAFIFVVLGGGFKAMRKELEDIRQQIGKTQTIS